MSWRKLAIVDVFKKFFAIKPAMHDTHADEIVVKKVKLVESIVPDSAAPVVVVEEENRVEKLPVATESEVEEPAATQQQSPSEAAAPKKAAEKAPHAKEPSKREQKLKLYHDDILKHLGEVDDNFLQIVVKNLGPSIYRKDAETVSCSDPKELETVKNNFLVRKLKMKKEDKEALDATVQEVCEKLKGVKNRYRATFYYMLAKNLGKEDELR